MFEIDGFSGAGVELDGDAGIITAGFNFKDTSETELGVADQLAAREGELVAEVIVRVGFLIAIVIINKSVGVVFFRRVGF